MTRHTVAHIPDANAAIVASIAAKRREEVEQARKWRKAQREAQYQAHPWPDRIEVSHTEDGWMRWEPLDPRGYVA